MKKNIRISIISLLGLTILYREVKQIDNTFFIDDFINIGLEIIALFLFIWVIYKDRKQYLIDNIWTAYLPTISGFTILIGLLTTLYILGLRDKSPVKFACVSKIVDFNGVHIDFREDGTYKLDNFCMGSNFFRGKYTIKDSIITLDKMNIDKVIESNRLVIRADGDKDNLGNTEKSIYQIDNNGKRIDRATDFRLLENKK